MTAVAPGDERNFIALFTLGRSAAPRHKLEFVPRFQEQGTIVGDSVNDAPVLGQAQVSVTLAGGTQLAPATADSSSCGLQPGRGSPDSATRSAFDADQSGCGPMR